ncbi:MAG: orotidine-5'-phosphate decarboxylase [Planctomycetota bacterium]
MRNFADRLMDAIDAKGSRLAVGLDPRIAVIPEELRRAALDRCPDRSDAAADMILAFNRAVIEIAAPLVPAVKVQVAFYELFGAAGYAAFERTCESARQAGLIVIADVKRSDIGSTAAAYANAHIGAGLVGDTAVHEGEADAITIVPFFGSEGVQPFLDIAAEHGRGVFVMVRSSNPSAFEVQGRADDPDPLYLRLADLVAAWGEPSIGERGYSAVGAVAGATFGEDIPRLRERMPNALLLLPGFGAQGAEAGDVAAAFDKRGHGGLVPASRSIIHAHKDPANPDWKGAIGQAVRALNAQLDAALPPLRPDF